MDDHTDRCRSKLRNRVPEHSPEAYTSSSLANCTSYNSLGYSLHLNLNERANESSNRLSKDKITLTQDVQTQNEMILRTENSSNERDNVDNHVACPKTDREQKTTSGLILPDINLNPFLCCDKRVEEIRAELDKPDFQFIRHTRSGIAYNFMNGPPSGKPRRLPKIVSDGAIRYKRKDTDNMRERISSSKRKHRYNIRLHGEDLTDQLRMSAHHHRIEREKKNLEKARCLLELQEDRCSRLGCMSNPDHQDFSVKNTATRIREITAKQDTIRENEHIQNMTRIMKHMKRH